MNKPILDQNQLAALAALEAGELVIVPTDTVYGVACRADRQTAIDRLYAAKIRPADKPLPILLAEAGDLPRVCARVPEAARKLAQAFWPGPLTLIVPRGPDILPAVTAGGETVGVRVPNLSALQAVLACCEFPVATTSANLSGFPAAVTSADLATDLRAAVAFVWEAGACPGKQASTVVDTTVEPPVILRPGPISESDILRAIAAAD